MAPINLHRFSEMEILSISKSGVSSFLQFDLAVCPENRGPKSAPVWPGLALAHTNRPFKHLLFC